MSGAVRFGDRVFVVGAKKRARARSLSRLETIVAVAALVRARAFPRRDPSVRGSIVAARDMLRACDAGEFRGGLCAHGFVRGDGCPECP